MPAKCGDALCLSIVDVSKGHVRLGDHVFCGQSCAQAWMQQNKLFEEAADPFHRPFPRREPTTRTNGG